MHVCRMSGAISSVTMLKKNALLFLSSAPRCRSRSTCVPKRAPEPAQVEFGAVDLHFGTPQQNVKFTNPSLEAVSVSGVELAGAEASRFQIVADSCSAPPSAAAKTAR